jgi:hypothetical protein
VSRPLHSFLVLDEHSLRACGARATIEAHGDDRRLVFECGPTLSHIEAAAALLLTEIEGMRDEARRYARVREVPPRERVVGDYHVGQLLMHCAPCNAAWLRSEDEPLCGHGLEDHIEMINHATGELTVGAVVITLPVA